MDDVRRIAIQFVKTNKKHLVYEYCNPSLYLPSKNPLYTFMAGSPGAGKTEFSKALIRTLEARDPRNKIIRLDTDELRHKIPLYNGRNSDDVQGACTILFDKIYDSILEHKQNAFVDGTFSSPKSCQNVERALERTKKVGISYLYLDPFIAWDYTKKREIQEGRVVPKSVFIHAFFESRNQVEFVKKKFGEKILLDVYILNEHHNFENRVEFNVDTISGYIKEKYTAAFLDENLPNSV